jgi:enamine deaminase RidA (YjgF/YER057c/UK114 family)
MSKKAYPAYPEVPISRAIRAGDFVFTSAHGPWRFVPKEVTFDSNGRVVDDGAGRSNTSFDEQVHLTFGYVKAALAAADCTLDDVVDCQVWLADPRDFVRFNEIFCTYFQKDPPVRSVFPSGFMFNVKVEIKVIAYKPLSRT